MDSSCAVQLWLAVVGAAKRYVKCIYGCSMAWFCGAGGILGMLLYAACWAIAALQCSCSLCMVEEGVHLRASYVCSFCCGRCCCDPPASSGKLWAATGHALPALASLDRFAPPGQWFLIPLVNGVLRPLQALASCGQQLCCAAVAGGFGRCKA